MTVATISLLIMFALSGDTDNKHYYMEMTGLIVVVLGIAEALWRRVHWSVALPFAYLAVSGLLYAILPPGYGLQHNDILDSKVGHEVAIALATMLLFAMLALTQKREYFDTLMSVIFMVVGLDAVLVIGRDIFLHKPWGMMSNVGMDASLIACLLPMSFKVLGVRNSRVLAIPLIPIMVAAIVLTGSSTGLAGIGVAVAAYLLRKYRMSSLPFVAVLSVLLPYAGYRYLGRALLDDQGRFHQWRIVTKFLFEHGYPVFGMGPGSYAFWGPAIQVKEMLTINPSFKGNVDVFVWLHNDWLQTFFEAGMVGTTLVVSLFAVLLYRSWRQGPMQFASWCVLGTVSVTQMPLRLFVFQLMALTMLMCTFRTSEPSR